MRKRRKPRRAKRWRDLALTALFLAVAAVFAVLVVNHEPTIVRGKGYAVDGDTLVIDGRRLRLFGIDAPELDQTCTINGSDYGCGGRARAALRQLMESGPLECKYREMDRYDRPLVTCEAGSRNINREMVLSGWATEFGGFAEEEQLARQNRRGVWAGTFDPPQQWRAMQNREHEKLHVAPLLLDRMAHFISRLRNRYDQRISQHE